MPRVRDLNPGFFTDDELAEVEPLGRILFAGLWCIADREGRLKDRPKWVKVHCLPYDDVDVDNLLTTLHDRELIHRYVASDGGHYIAIPGWAKYQRIHWKEPISSIPSCSDEVWSKLESSKAQACFKDDPSLRAGTGTGTGTESKLASRKKDPRCQICHDTLSASDLADERVTSSDGMEWWHVQCKRAKP